MLPTGWCKCPEESCGKFPINGARVREWQANNDRELVVAKLLKSFSHSKVKEIKYHSLNSGLDQNYTDFQRSLVSLVRQQNSTVDNRTALRLELVEAVTRQTLKNFCEVVSFQWKQLLFHLKRAEYVKHVQNCSDRVLIITLYVCQTSGRGYWCFLLPWPDCLSTDYNTERANFAWQAIVLSMWA